MDGGNDTRASVKAAMVAAMMPQIDEVLNGFFESLDAAMRQASEAETDRCILAVESCRMTGASPIGPLHGAGWNDAIKFAADSLRRWKAASAPTGGKADGR
jgi:hypothetical protein